MLPPPQGALTGLRVVLSTILTSISQFLVTVPHSFHISFNAPNYNIS